MSALVSAGSDQIVVVASTDDNYAYPLGVMFVSLLANTQIPEKISLFVIDGGISEEKKIRLRNCVESRKASLTFLDVNNGIYASFPTIAQLSAPAYYRISIPELFDSSVKRAIYLDCDLIVQGDISTLWNTSLDGYGMAAVENISSRTYRKSGLAQLDFFNSGVMLLDLEHWRKHSIPEEVRRFLIDEQPGIVCDNDQCALNGVFKGKWKRLPIEWNHQSGLYKNSEQTNRFKQQNLWDEAVYSPSIIHYVGWAKPWIRPCFHPLKQHFFHYADLSGIPIVTTASPLDGSMYNPRRHVTQFKKYLRQKKWQSRYRSRGFKLY